MTIYAVSSFFFLFWFRACFQIAEGSALGVQEFLEEFLNGWGLRDVQYETVIAEANIVCESRIDRHLVLGIDEYLQVVEVYAVTLLATVLKDVDLAISWVENASLPEENRQVNKVKFFLINILLSVIFPFIY